MSQVHWTESYRYLGLTLPANLDLAATWQRTLTRLAGTWSQYLSHTSVVTGSAASIHLQLFKTLVVSSCNYLLCLVEPSKQICDWVDTLAKSAAKHALALPDYALNATVMGAAGLLPFAAICARDRARFCAKLLHGELASPMARQLFQLSNEVALGQAPRVWAGYTQAQLAAPQRQPRSAGDLYYLNTARMCATWQTDYDMPPMIPTDAAEHSPNAQTYARTLAQKLWLRCWLDHIWRGRDMRYSAAAAAEELVLWATAESAAGRPLAPDSASYAAMTHCYFLSQCMVRQCSLPHTPLSVIGPGCSGNILVLPRHKTPRLQMAAMAAARLGRMGLSIPPFRPVDGTDLTPAGPQAAPQATRALFASFHERVPCRRCGAAPEDTFHVLTECQHPAVLAARATATAELPQALRAMATAAERAATTRQPAAAPQLHGDAQDVPPAPVQATITHHLNHLSALLQASITSGDWAEPLPAPHKYLLFMLLIAQPWPAPVATAMATNEQPVTSFTLSMLAHIFDTTYAIPYRTRPLAEAWVRWAGPACYGIAVAWGNPAASAQTQAAPQPAPRSRRLPAALRNPRPRHATTPARARAAAAAPSRPARLPPGTLPPEEDWDDTVLLPPQLPPTDLLGMQ